MLSYAAIEVRGGWPTLAKVNLAPGASGPEVAKLRARLAITDDLPAEVADGDEYDMMLTEAVKRFQTRHGLPETGSVGPQTLEALNVPVSGRLRQLAASLDRLNGMGFTFGQRYVVVNIPAAVAEAVEDGKVARRYVTVVGKVDRPSPTLTTSITAVNLNPTWTVPLSILKKDIVTKMRKDPNYVARMKMRVLDGSGNEIDRALGRLAVRPHAELHGAAGFRRRQCARQRAHRHAEPAFGLHARHEPQGVLLGRLSLPVLRLHARRAVRDLAAWILKDNAGWSRKEIDAEIATAKRTTVKLARGIPVAWIYLTGWASPDGTINFRNDVYNLDPKPAVQLVVQVDRPVRVSAARASGFVLQSDDAEPLTFRPVSYLDSR